MDSQLDIPASEALLMPHDSDGEVVAETAKQPVMKIKRKALPKKPKLPANSSTPTFNLHLAFGVSLKLRRDITWQDFFGYLHQAYGLPSTKEYDYFWGFDAHQIKDLFSESASMSELGELLNAVPANLFIVPAFKAVQSWHDKSCYIMVRCVIDPILDLHPVY
jgi:hypothetical protein